MSKRRNFGGEGLVNNPNPLGTPLPRRLVYGIPAVACGRIERVKINILNYKIVLLKIY
jgi:hypothetical protein